MRKYAQNVTLSLMKPKCGAWRDLDKSIAMLSTQNGQKRNIIRELNKAFVHAAENEMLIMDIKLAEYAGQRQETIKG